MKLERPLRFPFSLGSTPAQLAFGLAIIGFIAGGPLFFGSLIPDWMVFVPGLALAAWFVGIIALPFELRKHRASDLIVDQRGVTIKSGPHHGLQLDWSQLMHLRLFRFTEGSQRGTRLSLTDDIVVHTDEDKEAASWVALVDSLRTLARGFTEAASPAPELPVANHVLCCSSCGATAAPSADATTHCRFCGAAVAVPEPLRAALADAERLVASRVQTRRMLGEIQRWRRARTINLVFSVALALLALSWPVMASFTSEYFQYHDALRWRDVVQLFFATMALSVGSLMLVQSQLVVREAFALVAATFHARPPKEPGWPPSCRHCAAPLRVTPAVPLVVCPYCRADNVMLGVLLPHSVDVEVKQKESLDVILTRRRRARRRWHLGFVMALLLMGQGGRVIVDTVGRVRAADLPRHPPVNRAWSYEPPWVIAAGGPDQ